MTTRKASGACVITLFVSAMASAQAPDFKAAADEIVKSDAAFSRSVAEKNREQFLSFIAEITTFNGGTVTTGEREIEPAEAAIVERMFREFVVGVSPKQIAKNLNRERVPGPFGGPWSPSTIYGNAKRGTGILNNELYVGRLVWNRLR